MGQNKNIPMRVVKEETGLSSRQIRYYDEVDLIFPERSPGNQRLFSEQDIKRLKQIKSLLTKGHTITSVKKKLNLPEPIKGDLKEGNNIIKREINRNKYRGNKLNSLYPVSNRSHLNKVLKKKDK